MLRYVAATFRDVKKYVLSGTPTSADLAIMHMLMFMSYICACAWPCTSVHVHVHVGLYVHVDNHGCTPWLGSDGCRDSFHLLSSR